MSLVFVKSLYSKNSKYNLASMEDNLNGQQTPWGHIIWKYPWWEIVSIKDNLIAENNQATS